MNLNPFTEKSLNTFNHNKGKASVSLNPLDPMYVTATGFGKQSKAVNKAQTKSDTSVALKEKENQEKDTFSAEDQEMTEDMEQQLLQGGFITNR